MKESELKLQVEQYLEYQMNMGNLLYLRLNSGNFIEVRGETRRRIKGCPKGTADLVVIKDGHAIFLELKSEKGRWSPEQRAFKILAESQGAEYHLIREIEELENILG